MLADYETFSGKILERYFRQKYRETGFYNIVTNYWDKNNLNEIDLIAVNEVDHILIIGECKRNAKRINLHTLQEKSQTILQKQKRFKAEYVGMSLDDM